MPKNNNLFYLSDVQDEFKFYLRNGKTVKNLEELAEEFPNMDLDTFYHHVNEGKNDFANWIKDVIKDEKLAESISPLKGKDEIHQELLSRIETLKSYGAKGKKRKGGKKK